jgi:hypothetical protein
MTTLYATKDNAQGQLDSGISAASLTITLGTGEGAEFPQPYSGACSSAGTSQTLNDTGDLGSLTAGMFIRNVTDGSWARVLTTGANTITTTRLRDGTDNTWDSGDVWRVNEFIVSLEHEDSNGNVTKTEKALISARSTDQLTVPTGGRGYDSSVAQTFDGDDYVRLHVTSLTVEDMQTISKSLAKWVDENQTSIATNATNITNLQKGVAFWLTSVAGTDTITAEGTPTVTAYSDGMVYNFSAANTITGAATLNIDTVGAKEIRKFTGGSEEALTAGDIVANQVVTVVYDSALDGGDGAWVMASPLGQSSGGDIEVRYQSIANSSTVGASSTSEADMDVSYTIPANDWAAGAAYRLDFSTQYRLDSGSLTLRVKLGATVIGASIYSDAINEGFHTCYMIIRCRTTGASGTVYPAGASMGYRTKGYGAFDNNLNAAPDAVTIDTTGTLELQVSAQFSASNAAHYCQTCEFSVTKINAA